VTGYNDCDVKKVVSGKLFIFKINCYFQGKFFRPPVKCIPVRLCFEGRVKLKGGAQPGREHLGHFAHPENFSTLHFNLDI